MIKYQTHSTLISLKLSFTVIIGLGKQKISNVIGLAAHRLHWLFGNIASELRLIYRDGVCVFVREKEREGERERKRGRGH